MICPWFTGFGVYITLEAHLLPKKICSAYDIIHIAYIGSSALLNCIYRFRTTFSM